MILVAGGTGHLGVELVPALTSAGHKVRVLTRDPGQARRLFDGAAELVAGDVSRRDTLSIAMKGVDTVISAVTGFGLRGLGPTQVDYEGNVNLITAAQAEGVGRFLLFSMHDARPDHPMELLRQKKRAEQFLQASPLRWTIVRPTVFMELWAGLIGDPILKSGRTTVFGPGTNPINFVSVRDLAQVVVLLLRQTTDEDEVVEVGGPRNLSFNDLVRLIEASSGRLARVTHIPLPAMRLMRMLMRPFRADLAGFLEAGIATATTDMTLDCGCAQPRFPELEPTTIETVIKDRYSPD